jgi:hypothetical protein
MALLLVIRITLSHKVHPIRFIQATKEVRPALPKRLRSFVLMSITASSLRLPLRGCDIDSGCGYIRSTSKLGADCNC